MASSSDSRISPSISRISVPTDRAPTFSERPTNSPKPIDTCLSLTLDSHPVVIEGTIEDNMTFGRPSPSPEDIQWGLRFVKLDEEIHSLPDGLTAMVIGHGETVHPESAPVAASRPSHCDMTAHLDRRRHATQHASVRPRKDLTTDLSEGRNCGRSFSCPTIRVVRPPSVGGSFSSNLFRMRSGWSSCGLWQPCGSGWHCLRA